MKEKKRTRIFALMHNKKVFIGRCTAMKLSAVVYDHCRGKHIQTQQHFDLDRKRPDLYVLEEVENESQITYRHWLAWIQVFESEGYEVLNREDVLEDSRDMHPETHQIYEQIRKMPLELHLQFGYCSQYTANDFVRENTKPNSKITPLKNLNAATEKLSVRMSKPEKDLISSYAKCLNLSLRDAVLYAINSVMRCDDKTMAAEQEMYAFRQRYLQDVEKYKKKNSDLSEQLKNQRQKYSEKLEKHRKEMDTIMTGIHKYLSYLEPDTTIPLQIEQEKYRNFIYNTETDYRYPEKEGFAVIRPHAILRGVTPQVQFLVGTTDQGENIKLRHYPSKHFVGMFPANAKFGLRGSCWLVGWEQKEENVMQLNFAMPLSTHQKYDNPMAVGTELGKMIWEINQGG